MTLHFKMMTSRTHPGEAASKDKEQIATYEAITFKGVTFSCLVELYFKVKMF